MTVVTVVVTCFIQYSAGFMFLCFFQLDLTPIMVYNCINCDVSGGPRQWSGWYLRFDLGRRIPEVFLMIGALKMIYASKCLRFHVVPVVTKVGLFRSPQHATALQVTFSQLGHLSCESV